MSRLWIAFIIFAGIAIYVISSLNSSKMHKGFLSSTLLVVTSSLFLTAAAQTATPGSWTKSAAKKWFSGKEWLNGVTLTPHKSIDQQEFARQYHLNKVYWDSAFAFLKEHDLQTIAKGKYPIDGDHVFATVTEDPTKDFEKTNWESHRKYVDIQCVITGVERMGVSPVTKATVTEPYDEKKDVAHYTVEGTQYDIPAGTFVVFFSQDAHRPNITPGGNKPVKKIVIKVQAAE